MDIGITLSLTFTLNVFDEQYTSTLLLALVLVKWLNSHFEYRQCLKTKVQALWSTPVNALATKEASILNYYNINISDAVVLLSTCALLCLSVINEKAGILI